jgi:hypothetical protein
MTRHLILLATIVVLGFGEAAGGGKFLTQDPLTNLPLIPQTDSRLHLGNEPEKLPDTTICKSKVQMDFYALFDVKTSATISWYAAHLSGFKKVHGYGMNRSQDAFYNSDGTMLVGITGSPAPDGQDSEGHGVVYMRAQPGLSEKTIASLGQGKTVCP